MKNLPNLIAIYVQRFNEQYSILELAEDTEERLVQLIQEEKADLNNLFMAGLGASTLILRLGAVVQLSKKLEEGALEADALLMKQIVDNLQENLPSDTSWRVIWDITTFDDSPWKECVKAKKGHQSLMEQFITFRNKYVHGYLSLKEQDLKKISTGIATLHEICNNVSRLFLDTEIKEIDGKYFFICAERHTPLYPFLQKGSNDGLPYIFQGLYNNKSTAELINTHYGDIEKQDGSQHYDSVFEPMRRALKGGGGQVFDHSKRIAYYSECFVGRELENQAIVQWAKDAGNLNILPIFSKAGMGKGALMANVVQDLGSNENNIPVLYHFCSSGMQNNLHATLYHFILQGKKQQIWKTEDKTILQKLLRLPSKYTDLINLFHLLLDECFTPSRKNSTGNLIILLDGLDDAAVSFPQLNISDWFNSYDENGDILNSWESSKHIRWLFTYREGFYRFPKKEQNAKIEILQPMLGLSEGSVREALGLFKPSEDFVNEVIIRGAVAG
ncbi:MAG: hypothetical protein ISP74_02950 [Bacteroidia bacterium]|nr:hypothetical protein [Bacteroidia bacterium]